MTSECDSIYCRKKARARLKERGYNEEEAKQIAEDVYNVVKRVYGDGKK
jgi:hypothetical protein